MPAVLDVDPDVFETVGRTFLDVNDAVCDIVAAAGTRANTGRGMAGVDSTGATWARAYDSAADALLRAGSTVVEALGVVGDRLSATGANHADADASSVPRPGAAGPPAYSGQPGTTRAVSVVVSTPPSADGTPTDPPPGWGLIANLIAWTWPAGHPDQLIDVGTGWLTASLKLSDQADRLSGPIADLSGQTSPEVPYALRICTGLQTTLRTLADQHALIAQACTGYAGSIQKMHRQVIAELVDLVATEAAIQIIGFVASVPTAGVAEVPTQGVAASRATLAAIRVCEILKRFAEEILTLENLVQGVSEQVVSVLLELRKVSTTRDTLQAVTALVDAGIPPFDVQANEDDNPPAHVVERHVGKSDDYLKGRGIPIASTFTSMAAATTTISTVLAANGPEIATWLAGNGEATVVTGPVPPGAGRCYLQDSRTFVSATQIRVVLRRNAHGYYVFTVKLGP